MNRTPPDPPEEATTDDLIASLAEAGSLGEFTTLIEEAGQHVADETLRLNTPESVDDLRRLYQEFHVENMFKVGDVVRWKPGLRNKRHPADGQPAVVFGVYETPRLNPATSGGSAYFGEPLDIVIGYFTDDDEDLDLYHVDSRRFEHHPDYEGVETSRDEQS